MASTEFDAIFLIRDAPHVEFRDGLFHVRYDIGKRASFEIVMSPKVFVKTRLLVAEACAKWRGEQAPADNVRNIRGGKP